MSIGRALVWVVALAAVVVVGAGWVRGRTAPQAAPATAGQPARALATEALPAADVPSVPAYTVTPMPPTVTPTAGPAYWQTALALAAESTRVAGVVTAYAAETEDARRAIEWQATQTQGARYAHETAQAGAIEATRQYLTLLAGATATARSGADSVYATDYAREASWQALQLGSLATRQALASTATTQALDHDRAVFWEWFWRLWWAVTAAILLACLVWIVRALVWRIGLVNTPEGQVYRTRGGYGLAPAAGMLALPAPVDDDEDDRPAPFAVTAHGQPAGYVQVRSAAEVRRDEDQRAGMLAFLHAVIEVVGEDATVIPTFDQIPDLTGPAGSTYSEGTRTKYVALLKPFGVRTRNGFGTWCSSEDYPTVGRVRTALHRRQIRLAPAPPPRAQVVLNTA